MPNMTKHNCTGIMEFHLFKFQALSNFTVSVLKQLFLIVLFIVIVITVIQMS